MLGIQKPGSLRLVVRYRKLRRLRPLTRVPQFERADAVMMRVGGDFHVIFGTTFSIDCKRPGTGLLPLEAEMS